MIQKEILKFDCLFLHDTQMADLQKEQTILRKLYAPLRIEKNEALSVPFNCAPPFCPAPEKKDFSGKLMIGKPINNDGWIIRPITDEQSSTALAISECPLPALPGFPPLPSVSGFVIGFAGAVANDILERYEKAPHITDFRVNVWNYGLLTLEIEVDSINAYSCSYCVGPVTWKKSH